jgi:hypothetical protein
MLFRPEEVHGASGIRDVFEPLPERHGHISHEAFWIAFQNHPIAYLHPDG